MKPLNPTPIETEKRFRRDTRLLFIAQLYYRVCGFLMIVALSRALSSQDLGIYFYGISLAETLLFFVNLNLNPALMRETAAQTERAGTTLNSILGWRVGTFPLYLLGVGVVALALNPTVALPCVAIALCVWLEDFYAIFATVFIARRRIAYNVALGVPIQSLLLVALVVGVPRVPHLWFVFLSNVTRGFALVLCAALLCARTLYPLRLRWDARLLRDNLSLTAIRFLSILRERADTLLLGLWLNYTLVGRYSLALRVLTNFNFIPATFGQALFPRLAADGATPENRKAFAQTLRFAVGIGTGGAFVLLFAAEPLCRLLYGANGVEAATLLRKMAPLFPLGFAEQLLIQALMALSEDRRHASATLLGSLLGIGGNIVLIPLWGANGAVCAQIASTGVRLILLWRIYQTLQPKTA